MRLAIGQAVQTPCLRHIDQARPQLQPACAPVHSSQQCGRRGTLRCVAMAEAAMTAKPSPAVSSPWEVKPQSTIDKWLCLGLHACAAAQCTSGRCLHCHPTVTCTAFLHICIDLSPGGPAARFECHMHFGATGGAEGVPAEGTVGRPGHGVRREHGQPAQGPARR